MKTKEKIRISIDSIMMILLPLLMLYSILGERAHEWLGIIMTVLFILHHILNWKWYINLRKGKYTLLRVTTTIINTLLLIIMIVLPISGISMSRYVLDLPAGNLEGSRLLHLFSAYWGFVLMSLHLGLHWNRMLGAMKVYRHPKLAVVLRISAICISIFGLYSFIALGFIRYLLLLDQFVFLDFSKPLLLSLAERVSIMVMLAAISYYGSKLLRARSR